MERLLGAVRTILVVVIDMAIHSLRVALLMLRLTVLTIGSFWTTIPRNSGIIADEWSNRADRIGFPTRWKPQLRATLQGVAILMMIVGWVVTSFLTVGVVRLLFVSSDIGWYFTAAITYAFSWAVVIIIFYWLIKLIFRR